MRVLQLNIHIARYVGISNLRIREEVRLKPRRLRGGRVPKRYNTFQQTLSKFFESPSRVVVQLFAQVIHPSLSLAFPNWD